MFSIWLQMKRREKNMTQTQLAEALAISQALISYWEAGKRLPSKRHISLIAEQFNTPVKVIRRMILNQKMEME